MIIFILKHVSRSESILRNWREILTALEARQQEENVIDESDVADNEI